MRAQSLCFVAGLGVLLVAACANSGKNDGFLPPAGTGGASGPRGGGSGGATGSGGSGTGNGSPDASSTPGDGGGGAGPSTDPRVNVDLVWKSSGCGKDLPANQQPTTPGQRQGYTEYHVMQTGATLAATDPSKAVDRLFWIRVPANYDKNKAYRVVYIGQGCGGGNGRDNTWTLFDESRGGSEQAIYVAMALPPNNPNGACYDNEAGASSQEWEAFALFHAVVESKYCADNNRVYIAGYSSGGWVANMWGCYFAGIPDPPRKFAPNFRLRGQASVTGGLPAIPQCNGRVAGIWIHDAGDTANVIAGSYAARDRVLAANGCAGSPTAPWAPMSDVCVQYTACPKEFPVVFCTTNGQGHGDQPTRALPAFAKFFDMMGPMP